MTTPEELQAKLSLGIEKARTNSRLLVFVGACLILVSLTMSWWSLERYRVYEQRGRDLMVASERDKITEKMSEEQKKKYDDQVALYLSSWRAIVERHKDFYVAEFGKEYETTLDTDDRVNKGSSYLIIRGISTWTGRFGFLFLLAGLGWYLAPKFHKDFEDFAWTIPWVWTVLATVFLVASLSFYFGVPDVDGDGYSQGISMGWYIGLLGALAVVVGGTFEGIKTGNERLAMLAAHADEEHEEEAEDEEGSDRPRPMKEPKPPVDERAAAEEAKRKRLTDW